MAVPAALIPPTPLVPPPPISTSSATTSPPSTTSSPSPSLVPPTGPGQNLFRSELLATSSPGIPTPTAALPPSKPVYSTPSPVENIPQNNECKMVELRGAKVASFTVDGCELICLPQAFDLFLKHLVGGLHTVYTKLKRLEITPVVCNVEQVRILRGLGAIQPGVNRCKLISRKDFETLYNDCTNASSRPGRPPKRTQSVTSPENPHIMPHSVPGLMSPGMIPPTGLTAAAAAAANAAIAEAMKVKKIKLEAMSGYHGNANHHGADGENGDLSSGVGLELPFMMMPHPLIPVSLPPASVTMAMSQMNHLSTIANMAAAAQGQSLPSRMVTSVIKGLQERVPDSPSPAPSLEDNRRPGSHPSSHRSSSVSSSPAHTESSSDRIPVHHNGLSMNQALLGLSPNIAPGPKEGDLAHDMSHEVKRMHTDKEDNSMCTPTARDSYERLSLAGQTLPPGFPSPFLFPDGLSSIETLLTNIQGLLKVAIDNARAQEKQVQLEKTELKMELFRERELRETLEKQLAMEQKNRAIIQKRLKKEKKAKRKLQEALEYESKRREQVEQTLKQPSPSDSMRSLNDSLTPEMESDRSSGRTDAERTIQDGRLFLKTAVMY
ncbi:dachshund homolog 1-like isoform X4 [Xiphophorus maculatus]|uniref:Dachshund d n=1 Tax=Xiphophorus maculatus TaxID=8083 RepID=M4A987_XIPMA|nr:dachshund homolog 1-like isoform X4 [Xiphophorus maculatus]XP_027878148.1 dachshund homolog 1-like isoform X5 [Xiphophorus couchianus]XP_032423965.1 dachshund homolog 1-like isoform X5 [Xiphophorus hellerii]